MMRPNLKPMRTRTRVTIALLLLLRHASSLFAWNATGHMTVALMAYRELSDAQKQQVTSILRSHPHYKLFLLEGAPQGVSPDEWAFLRASIWSDFVRPARPGSPGKKFKTAAVTRYNRALW